MRFVVSPPARNAQEARYSGTAVFLSTHTKPDAGLAAEPQAQQGAARRTVLLVRVATDNIPRVATERISARELGSSLADRRAFRLAGAQTYRGSCPRGNPRGSTSIPTKSPSSSTRQRQIDTTGRDGPLARAAIHRPDAARDAVDQFFRIPRPRHRTRRQGRSGDRAGSFEARGRVSDGGVGAAGIGSALPALRRGSAQVCAGAAG